MFVLIALLAITWMALQSSFSLADLIVGLAIGYSIVALTSRFLSQPVTDGGLGRPRMPVSSVARLTLKWAAFIGFALWSIVKANFEVARIVIRPRLNIKPGIIAIPLDVQSEAGVTVLANLITLTPGTVTLDVSSDRRTIYVHSIDIQDADAIRDDIKLNFERRVMELLP